MSKDQKYWSTIKDVKGSLRESEIKDVKRSQTKWKDHKSDGIEIKVSKYQISYGPNGINDITITLVAIAHIFMHIEE